jgi:heat shock protein HslJ
MTKSFLLPLLAAGALILAACGSDSPSGDSPDLAGHEFLSMAVEGHDLVEGTEIRIGFTDGSLSAHAGCNSMGGDYTIDGDILDVGPMFATEMGCEQALMDQDTWLAEFLTSAPTASLDSDVLVLERDGTIITMLDRESARGGSSMASSPMRPCQPCQVARSHRSLSPTELRPSRQAAMPGRLRSK